MGALEVSDKMATRNDDITYHAYDGDEYECFGRFRGSVTATLLVDAGKVEIIMNRFGDSAELIKKNEETAKVVVKVHESEQFFGWLARPGDRVRIDGLKKPNEEYKSYLNALIS